jgi:flagellar motor switch protein FliN
VAAADPAGVQGGVPNEHDEALARFQPLDQLPLRLSVELGRTPRKLRELLDLRVGSILVLDKSTGESAEIRVNDILLARGEVVAGDESFAVRVTGVVEHGG